MFQTWRDSVERVPAWFEPTGFDIAAKCHPETGEREPGPLLRTLVAREFKLNWHMETKPQDAYSLVTTRCGSRPSPSAMHGSPLCQRGLDSLNCTNLTTGGLAERLPIWAPTEIERTVVDQTGLTEAFDFKLEWVSARRAEAKVGLGLKFPPSLSTGPSHSQ